jgi:hypothetical protein
MKESSMANGAKGAGDKSKARARARGQIGKINKKTKAFFAAIKQNVDSNIAVLDDLTSSLLADERQDNHDCATDLCAATVAWWGNAMDLFHNVVSSCLPDQDPPTDPSPP